MNVLITGGGGAGSALLFDLLGQRYQLHFADADPEAIDPTVPVWRRHRLPLATSADFVPDIVDLCQRLGIALLAPAVDEELERMAEVARQLPQLDLLMPEPGQAVAMMDKVGILHLLEESGVSVPGTTTFRKDHGLGYPLLVKPRWGRGSRGVAVVEGPDQLAAYQTLSGLAAERIVLQECMQGVEYTVMMAADRHGVLRAVVPVRVFDKRGITLHAATDDDPVVIAACRAIHDRLNARGCYNIQLMRDLSGSRARPFEINPRISTTSGLGVAAGVDPVAIHLGTSARSSRLLPFRVGLTLRRHWRNHVTAGDGAGPVTPLAGDSQWT